MVTFEENVQRIIKQIFESYQTLLELEDKPGDLEIIKIELLKMNGLFKVVNKKIDLSKNYSNDYVKLSKRVKHYLQNYNFIPEIETMANLYSNDPHRLKNIRLKIIESLQDKDMIETINIILKS